MQSENDSPIVQALSAKTQPEVVSQLAVTAFIGKSWYVDATLGADSNAGTIDKPWKTLAQVAKGKYAAGDAVLLKCGNTWRESLTLSNGNAPNGKLTLGVYGTCTSSTLPVIAGSDNVSGTWQLAGGSFAGKSVYVAKVSQPVSYLFWNGAPLVKARYPNFGGITSEFSLIAQTINSKTFKLSPEDAAVLGSTSLAGATAYIRTTPYSIEAIPVASSNPSDSTVVLATAPSNPLQAKQGFYIEGKQALLDTAGEWYWDSGTGNLYVWTPGNQSPAAGLLESVQRATGLTIINIPGAIVDQIVFSQQSTTTAYLVGSKGSTFSSVIVKNAVRDGIVIDGGSNSADSSGSKIDNAKISGAGSNGIIIKSPSSVTNSQIDSTGISPIFTGEYAGINVLANSVVVQKNKITRSGFRAIELGAVSGGTVSNNTISQACMRLTDCGAIYTYGPPLGTARTSVAANSISNIVPNPVGAVGGATSLAAAIYLDLGSSLLDVTSNMISGVETGIKLHDASNNTVKKNSVWLTATASLVVHSSNANTDQVRANVIDGNLFYASNTLVPTSGGNGLPTRKIVPPQAWMHTSNAASMFTGSKPNVVSNNVAGTMSSAGKVQWQLTSGAVMTPLNVQQWAQYAVGEQVQFAYPAPDLTATPSGPELVQNINLFTPGTPWKTWLSPSGGAGSITFGTCAGACADVIPGTKYDALMSNSLTMNPTSGSNLYLLHLSATAFSPMTTAYVGTNRLSDGANVGISSGVQLVNFEQSSYSTLFYAKTADLAQLVVNGVVGQGFRLADLGVYAVSSYTLFNPVGETALLSNETTNFKTVTCASVALRTCVASDLKGSPVVWPVMLNPGSSKVVVTADGLWQPKH
jgi:parallel beta-helix repeat protein